jgi:hypothetical protein
MNNLILFSYSNHQHQQSNRVQGGTGRTVYHIWTKYAVTTVTTVTTDHCCHWLSILSRVRVRELYDGFWIGWWDLFIPYTFTQFETTGNTALSLFYTLSSSHALGFSAYTSRTLATDLSVSLSLRLTHEVILAQSNHLRLPSQELEPVLFRLLFCTPYNCHSASTLLPRVRVTLRLAVYRQSVRLDVKQLETHDQRLFFPKQTLR